MDTEKVLVVKAPSEVHTHILWLLQQIEGVKVWEAEEVEDLLLGRILEASDVGDYVEPGQIAKVLDEAAL